MNLSQYHEQFRQQSDEEINRKANAKFDELQEIFSNIDFNVDQNPVRVAVLGCGDVRLIDHHRRIFQNILERSVEVLTFDISTEHLSSEDLVFQHDCTKPIPNGPFAISYSHVLLKFIETEKQLDLIKNSYKALVPGGVAIHIFDQEEIDCKDKLLQNGQFSVPLSMWKKFLDGEQILYKQIELKYGPALVILM